MISNKIVKITQPSTGWDDRIDPDAVQSAERENQFKKIEQIRRVDLVKGDAYLSPETITRFQNRQITASLDNLREAA